MDSLTYNLYAERNGTEGYEQNAMVLTAMNRTQWY